MSRLHLAHRHAEMDWKIAKPMGIFTAAMVALGLHSVEIW